MKVCTAWQNQDYLKIPVENWCHFLQDPLIFNEDALRMVQFVYRQTNHTSTASDIAYALSATEQSLSYQGVVAWNRSVGKKIYEYFDVIPPVDSNIRKDIGMLYSMETRVVRWIKINIFIGSFART